MHPTDEMIVCLHSIEATLKELLALSKTKLAAAPPPAQQEWHSQASDQDLDSQYGDELVKFKPRGWTGDFVKDTPMSQCQPAFLDLLAEAHDYFAKKHIEAGDDKKAGYEQRSARRARGWAARLRIPWTPPALATLASKDDITW